MTSTHTFSCLIKNFQIFTKINIMSVEHSLLGALWIGGWFSMNEFMPNLYATGNSCIYLSLGNENKIVMG